jgi:hypothetical protein
MHANGEEVLGVSRTSSAMWPRMRLWRDSRCLPVALASVSSRLSLRRQEPVAFYIRITEFFFLKSSWLRAAHARAGLTDTPVLMLANEVQHSTIESLRLFPVGGMPCLGHDH